jgi:hypothetical protein
MLFGSAAQRAGGIASLASILGFRWLVLACCFVSMTVISFISRVTFGFCLTAICVVVSDSARVSAFVR